MVRNHEGNRPPLGFGLSSLRPSLCRKPPQVHRPCHQCLMSRGRGRWDVTSSILGIAEPPRPAAFSADTSPLPEEHDCSISNFATGLSCWCREIIAVEGIKAYFLLPKACQAFTAAETGTAAQCSDTQVLWDRAERR